MLLGMQSVRCTHVRRTALCLLVIVTHFHWQPRLRLQEPIFTARYFFLMCPRTPALHVMQPSYNSLTLSTAASSCILPSFSFGVNHGPGPPKCLNHICGNRVEQTNCTPPGLFRRNP
jgi:hypothetical protein